jgi:aspartate/methionine/tyrosine aminotransferase
MTSMAEVYPDTVVLVGQSTTFGMTGWRLGYVRGSSEILQAMAKGAAVQLGLRARAIVGTVSRALLSDRR